MSPSAPLVPPRALKRTAWVWRSAAVPALLDERRFGITTILMWVAPGFSRNKGTMRDLRQLSAVANAAHVEFDALGGDPSWAQDPDVCGGWAKEVTTTGLFRRLHLDIEPHALNEWKGSSRKLAAGLLTAISAAKHAGLPIDVDIPYWYWQVSVSGWPSLDVAVLHLADSVTVMAYRRDVARVVAVVGPEFGHAEEAGKPALIGLNFAEPSGASQDGTMWGMDAAEALTAIESVESQGHRLAAFSGVALHDGNALAHLK